MLDNEALWSGDILAIIQFKLLVQRIDNFIDIAENFEDFTLDSIIGFTDRHIFKNIHKKERYCVLQYKDNKIQLFLSDGKYYKLRTYLYIVDNTGKDKMTHS